MSDQLRSARLKLKWASQHLDTLEDFMAEFIDSEPYRVAVDFDANTREKVWRVDGPVKPPPVEWSVILGEMLYDLRSALDHLAWQLVLVSGGTPDASTEFPIFWQVPKFEDKGLMKLRGMSPTAKTFIEDLQPCYRPNPTRQPLWTLHALNIEDKHHDLNLVVAATPGGFFHPLPSRSLYQYIGPLEDGTVLARVPADEVNVEFHPIYGVAFGEGGPAAGLQLVVAMSDWRSTVRRILEEAGRRFFL